MFLIQLVGFVKAICLVSGNLNIGGKFGIDGGSAKGVTVTVMAYWLVIKFGIQPFNASFCGQI